MNKINTYVTQKATLEKFLRGTGNSLTAYQAIKKFGIRNLSACLLDMRRAGLRVVATKNRYGLNKYSIRSRDINGGRAKIFG